MSSKSDQETIKCESTTKDGLGDIVQGGTDRHWFEPVLLDLQIPKDPAEEHLEAVGYSAALDLNVEFHCEAFRLTERPERVYVTGSENKKTYCFWFKNGRGTGEFDIEHGCLTLLELTAVTSRFQVVNCLSVRMNRVVNACVGVIRT